MARQVSAAYKEAVQRHRTQGYRDSTYADLYFGLIDYTAKPDSALSTSEQTSFSDAANMYSESRAITTSYATWEQDFFRLDGVQRLLPENGYAAQGFISQVISGADGVFAVSPYIDIYINHTTSLAGVTLLFDAISEQYPSDFTVRTWLDSALVKTINITDNTDIEFKDELYLDDFNHLRIDFTKTKPYQRIRINGFTFGIGYLYGGDDIISLTHTRRAHPLSLSIPESELRATLWNLDGRFRLDSETSIVRFLIEGQQMTLRYGLDIDGMGTIERFKAGIFELYSWSTEGNEATFIGKDVFTELSNTTYHKGTYSIANPKSTGQLAAEVLQDAGQNSFEVSNETVFTPLPLPITSHAECLQFIANLSSSIIEQIDSGAIVMRTTRDINPEEWNVSTTPGEVPELPYSNHDNIIPTGTRYEYATWEEDFFALDGSMRLLPEDGTYLDSGAVFDVFPTSGQYSYNGQPVGIIVDLTVPISFGSVSVKFSAHSSISRFRLIGVRNGGVTYQRDFNVTGITTTVEDYFTNIRYLYVLPLENSKAQRSRIESVSIVAQIWPHLTTDDVIDNAKDELMPAARDITVRYWPTTALSPERDPSLVDELMRTKVIPGELTEITHSAAFYHIEVEAPGNVVFDVEEHYAYVSFIQISGVTEETEIIFYGKVDEKLNSITLNRHLNDRGTDVPVENPLSSDINGGVREQLDWVSNYYSNRVQYEAETRGYPEVDAADFMTYEGKPAIVLENVITFNGGAMRGRMKFRGR